MIPHVVDISHYETVEEGGFESAKKDGIWGVISKATQGTGHRDEMFPHFTKDARAAGLLVGAYHFGDNSDPVKQAEFFLNSVKPPPDMLVSLDYEPYDSLMSPRQMVQFLHTIEQKLGRKAVLYSGNLIKETIGDLSDTDRAYVTSHKLWLTHFNKNFVLPRGWMHYFLHQYTGDGAGPGPHQVSGIHAKAGPGKLDLNVYDGDFAKLKSEWSGLLSAASTDDPTSPIVDPHKDHSLMTEVEEWFANVLHHWHPPYWRK